MFLHKKIPLFCRICHTPLIKNTANPPLSHITQKNGGLHSTYLMGILVHFSAQCQFDFALKTNHRLDSACFFIKNSFTLSSFSFTIFPFFYLLNYSFVAIKAFIFIPCSLNIFSCSVSMFFQKSFSFSKSYVHFSILKPHSSK